MIEDANEESLKKHIENASGVVIVDFWAPWCGPCKMMAPLLEEINENVDSTTLLKINVDEHPDLARQYGVRSIPTFMAFKDGVSVGTKVGALSKDQFYEWMGNL